MIAYKTLREDGSSLRAGGRVTYTRDWQEIPGNGAYCCDMEGDAAALTAGGLGPMIARLEVSDPVDVPDVPEGVRCYRRVRVVSLRQWSRTSCRRWGMIYAGTGDTVTADGGWCHAHEGSTVTVNGGRCYAYEGSTVTVNGGGCYAYEGSTVTVNGGWCDDYPGSNVTRL